MLWAYVNLWPQLYVISCRAELLWTREWEREERPCYDGSITHCEDTGSIRPLGQQLQTTNGLNLIQLSSQRPLTKWANAHFYTISSYKHYANL